MKTLLLFFSFLISLTAHCDCSMSGVNYWPTAKTINATTIIMIEGYAMDRKLVEGLGSSHMAFLQSGKHIVPLKVIEKLESEFHLAQALLEPTEKLIVGKIYELKIKNGSTYLPVDRWDEDAKKHVPVTWKVASDSTSKNPRFTAIPTIVERSFTRFGCGPASYIHVQLPIENELPCLVETIVRETGSTKEMRYYVQYTGEKFLVGHGMCSGEFMIEEKSDYEIRFQLMDASGGKSKQQTDWISTKDL